MIELSDAEEMAIDHALPWWRSTIVIISHCKIGLESAPADHKLKVFEHFEKMLNDVWLTPKMIAVIEPMPREGVEIIKEATKLPANPFRWVTSTKFEVQRTWIDVLGSSDVFRALCVINPSILEALKMSPRTYLGSAHV